MLRLIFPFSQPLFRYMSGWLLHTWMSFGMDSEDVPQVVRGRVHLISSSLCVHFTLLSLAFGVAHSPITASSLAL